MGEVDAADPTELAPSENETASVYAWGLDESDFDDETPTTRLTAGRITAAAVAVSLCAVAAAGLLGWQHLRTTDEPTTAVTSSMVPATTLAIPVAAPLPPSTPQPPPVTITTVIKQVPAPPVPVAAEVTPTYAGISPEVMASYDRQFLARIAAMGWHIDDPALMTLRGRQVCSEFAQGSSRALIEQKLIGLGASPSEAATLAWTATQTYPACP